MTSSIEAVRAALAACPPGWHCDQAIPEIDEPGQALIGADLDGYFYEVLTVDTGLYGEVQEKDALPLANFYAACNPVAITELLATLDAAIRERDELRGDAAMWRKWVPYLRTVRKMPYGLATDLDAARSTGGDGSLG